MLSKINGRSVTRDNVPQSEVSIHITCILCMAIFGLLSMRLLVLIWLLSQALPALLHQRCSTSAAPPEVMAKNDVTRTHYQGNDDQTLRPPSMAFNQQQKSLVSLSGQAPPSGGRTILTKQLIARNKVCVEGMKLEGEKEGS